MKKESFFILALIVLGGLMLVWTFFGGSGGGEEISSDVGTGFVDELVNTGVDISPQEVTQTNIPAAQRTHTEIRVMMPSYFYNAGWLNFAKDLYEEQKVFMNFIFIDDLNDYRDKLISPGFDEADLVLFPYDWIDRVATRSFSFQQNLSSVFDPLIKPIVSSEKTLFLPFAADPMIMYVSYDDGVKNTFSEISDFVYNRSSKKPNSFPLFFGVTSEDYRGEGFEWEYQDIVRYALMHYFTSYRDAGSLGAWVDSNVFENYNISNLNSLIKTISVCRENPTFPAICLQVYNLVGIRFGFLSDLDVVKKYYKGKKSDFEKLFKSQMPFGGLENPVRLWGRSMPASLKDATTVNAVYLFLSQYMNKHDQYPLRGSTLSVFGSFSNTTLYDNEFVGDRGYILSAGGNYIATVRSVKPFWQLIEYQISAKDYLKKM